MKVIITGATGMVGRSALNQCLESNCVQEVLLISRTPLALNHPKITELIHSDFSDFSQVQSELTGYDACFHCMGISSLGMNEQDYNHITYDMTYALASALVNVSPHITFNYLSGTGADSSEQGSVMWAKVKGKTENMLLNIGFADAYMFRLGALFPERNIKSKTALYNVLYTGLRPFFPILKKVMPITTSEELGRAMIHSVMSPQTLKILENDDINQLAIDT
ncbi:NAD-dependent epimerase/dehydratase family protein [Alteromonas stellipolaris]|uniref:Epimerase n=1 Tax=Alteromonas stellipolaris TaxID=233316 RepID=A0ABM5YQ40_9ALTE|nr:epimerase [Alteromonas stellipolaris]